MLKQRSCKTLKYILAMILLFIATVSFSQSNALLKRIAQLQVKDSAFYPAGLFPSKRLFGRRNLRDDNTIFFTALIVYTLQSVKEHMSPEDRLLADSIIARAQSNYQWYKNRNGGITYNFWQVRPEQPFPNSSFLSGMEKVKLPDDFDDTSMIYLTLQTPDSLNRRLKDQMLRNTNTGRVKSTFKKYREFQGYCTWFADRMKQDMDVCVMSNTLLFNITKNLEFTHADKETLSFIREVVMNDDHFHYPHIVASHYQNTSVILYHIARLLASATLPEFTDLRDKVIKDLYWQLQRVQHPMEQVILLSSLYRLGQKVGFQLDLDHTIATFDHFHWFVANPFYGSKIFVKRMVGKSNFLKFRYSCKAYYLALILELELLSTESVWASH